MNTPIAARSQLPPRPPSPPTTTANVPSGYSFILLQIRVSHRGVHPLGPAIGVHPETARGESGHPCASGRRDSKQPVLSGSRSLARDQLGRFCHLRPTHSDVQEVSGQATATTVPLARNSKCAFLELPPATHPPDPWTVHSLAFFLPGPHRGEILAVLQTFTPAPMIFDRHWTDRQTGEVVTLSHLMRLDFADPENAALLPLGKVAASLERFPWAAHPGLRVNRIDLASDHLVSPSPPEVCDRIAGLRLPYSRPYRGPQDAKDPWLTMYHNGGKKRVPGVVVVHYPRLESLLHRRSEAGEAALASAVELRAAATVTGDK